MVSSRRKLMLEIEKERDSNLICYIGGDRHNVSTRIAPDILSVFFKHLNKFDPGKKVDLFLYTKGGDVHTAHRLVQLIYEFTDRFSVIIPNKALSSGTLISLGASEIIMTKMADLGPIDPNITSIFNPNDPGNVNAKAAINVEDVYAYFNVAREVLKLKDEESIVRIFDQLTEAVHPLAIGSIQRTYLLIRSIAKKLLSTHINDKNKIDEIVNCLTENLFSHSYMISRKEALDSIGLPVIYPNDELERKIGKLFEHYKSDLLLDTPFYPQECIDQVGKFSVCSGLIESRIRTDGYVFRGIVQDNNEVCITQQGWENLSKNGD